VLPWRYYAELGTANLLHLRRNTANIMKGLVFGKILLPCRRLSVFDSY